MITVYYYNRYGNERSELNLEFNGKTKEGHYKLDSYNGWEFIITKDKKYITNHNDETFEIDYILDPFRQLV